MTEDDEKIGVEVLSLEREDGTSQDYMITNQIKYKGTEYLALLPYYNDIDEVKKHFGEENKVVFMKLSQENGQEVLEDIDDENEYAMVAQLFEK